MITCEPNELSDIYAKVYVCDGVFVVSECTETTRHLCEGGARKDPGSWQGRCVWLSSLARTGGSCVKERKDLLYSMRTPGGAARQGSQLDRVVLQHRFVDRSRNAPSSPSHRAE